MENITLYDGLNGPSVPPGRYTARVTANGHSDETGFELAGDPRRVVSAAEISEWSARIDQASVLLERTLTGLGELRRAGTQIEALMASHPDTATLQEAGGAALAAIEAWDHRVIQPLHQTYEDEDAWETRLAGQLKYLINVIDRSGAPITGGAIDRLADLQAEADALQVEKARIVEDLIAPINAWARENAIPHVTL